MKELWDKIIRFNDEHFPNWRKTRCIYYSNALVGETGEVCNALKHMVGGGTNNKNVAYGEEALGELVDVLIYSVLLSESMGYDEGKFEEAFNRKMEELERRMKGRKVEGFKI